MTIRGTLTLKALAWYLGILIPVFTWLATLPPPPEWSWGQWMGNLAILLGLVVAKLSPGSGGGDAGNGEAPGGGDPGNGEAVARVAGTAGRRIGTWLLVAAVLGAPALAAAQTPLPVKPSAPPALAGCDGTAEWVWSEPNGRWEPVCVTSEPQGRPAALPRMGLFCGRAGWEWAPGEGRWVAVCEAKSPLYTSIAAGGVTLTAVNLATTLQALQEGRIEAADPLMRPFASRPWLAGIAQGAIVVAEWLTTDDWFRRHPTVSGIVQVSIASLRATSIAVVATRGKAAVVGVTVPLR